MMERLKRIPVPYLALYIAACGGPAVEPAEPEPEVVEEEEPPEPEPPVIESSIPRGYKTVEEMGKAFVDALNTHDADLIASFFPPDEVVLSAVQCPGPNEALDEIHGEKKKFLSELPEMAGMSFEWIGLLPREEDVHLLEEGQTIDGCTVLKTITVKEVKARFLVTQGGETKEATENVTVARFGSDGLWFIVEM